MIALTLKGTETVSLKKLVETFDTKGDPSIQFFPSSQSSESKNHSGRTATSKTARGECFAQAKRIEPHTDNLTLTITIKPNSVIHIQDDLLTENDMIPGLIVKQKLEFFVHENSTVHYYLSMVPTDLEQKKSSDVICEKELLFRLVGPGANVQAHGSCFANGSQIFKFKTLQDHQVNDTTSNLLIKGVLDDAARLTCNSMIQICKGAQRSNALQANKNIVLSKAARAVSIPQLEIEANDVSCKHGAAVSNISDEHLFYLQSRGLSVSEARKMVIDGFLVI